ELLLAHVRCSGGFVRGDGAVVDEGLVGRVMLVKQDVQAWGQHDSPSARLPPFVPCGGAAGGRSVRFLRAPSRRRSPMALRRRLRGELTPAVLGWREAGFNCGTP